MPKRRGQPTVNVGADMMGAFLNEIKAHRLRKISNRADGSFSAEGHSTVSDVGVVPSRRSISMEVVPGLRARSNSVGSRHGEEIRAALKRKRAGDAEGAGEGMGELLRAVFVQN